MQSYSLDEIRKTFATSTDFNEIFDVFQAALSQKVKDVEPYRLLFWNQSLTPDEIRLFGEKLAAEFSDLAYDVYLWLASVFEVTCSSNDNYELAFQYYQKAAEIKPAQPEPYLDACDCFDPDLNIPPLASLVEFVKKGIEHVPRRASLYKRLAQLHETIGDTEKSDFYLRKAEEEPPPDSDEVAPAT
jgi:tetratricopeptide (TPR) repeat protein